MISPLILERPGAWRGAGIATGFLLAAAPVIVAALGLSGSSGPGQDSEFLDASFGPAMVRSLQVAGGVWLMTVSLFVIGLVGCIIPVIPRRPDGQIMSTHAGEKLTHWMWFVFPQIRISAHQCQVPRS